MSLHRIPITTTAPVLEVAIVGCGHMGRLHAETVTRSGGRVVATTDIVPERARRLAERYGARVQAEAPLEVDAVIVATPVTTHAGVAERLVRAGTWCLVEKALAHEFDAAERIAGPRVAVGHSERFNPAVRALGSLRVGDVRCTRRGPATGRGEDVDVVLDRMIHDLDLLAWWWGGVPDVVGVEGEPWGEVRVQLAGPVGGAVLTCSRGSHPPERHARLQTDAGPVELDLLRGAARREDEVLAPPDGLDALAAQWRAFVDRMRGRPSQVATAAEGLAASRLALRIRAALRDTCGA